MHKLIYHLIFKYFFHDNLTWKINYSEYVFQVGTWSTYLELLGKKIWVELEKWNWSHVCMLHSSTSQVVHTFNIQFLILLPVLEARFLLPTHAYAEHSVQQWYVVHRFSSALQNQTVVPVWLELHPNKLQKPYSTKDRCLWRSHPRGSSHLPWVVVVRGLQDKQSSFIMSSFIQHTNTTSWLRLETGRLRGLTVACWTTDHYHPCSNPGMGISEGCFVFHFVSLPLEVARPI